MPTPDPNNAVALSGPDAAMAAAMGGLGGTLSGGDAMSALQAQMEQILREN